MTYAEKLKLCAENGKDPIGDFIHDNQADIGDFLFAEISVIADVVALLDGGRAALNEAIHEIESYTDTENSNIEEAAKDASNRVRDMSYDS